MTLLNIFLIISAVQSMIIALILLFYKSKKRHVNSYLGYFFIVTFIQITSETISETLKDQIFVFSPFYLFTLDIVFLYLYATETTGLKLRNKFLLFVPAVVEFLFQFAITVLVLYHSDYINIVNDSHYIIIRSVLASTYRIFICILIIRVINVHSKLLPYSYKNIKYKVLTWLTVFCVICIAFNVFSYIKHLVFKNSCIITVINMSIFLISLYYITITSLVQINIYNLTDTNKLNTVRGKKGYSKKELKTYYTIVEKYMLEEKVFLDPTIDLKTFAKIVNLPSRVVSNCVNQINGTNFNGLIHTYRIDEFKKIVKDEKYKNYSIEGLSSEVGYNSRASFYKNFKKITGMNPSEYISNLYINR